MLALTALLQGPPAPDANQWIENVKDLALSYGPNVFWALVTLVIGWWLAVILSGFLRRTLERRKVDATLIGFLCGIFRAGLLVLVATSAAGRLGIQTTSFVAVLGAAGLAVGLALQSSLGNFASGVLIILLRPFKAGDFVELAGVSGNVQTVNIFSTTLCTPDNKLVIVPNSSITGANVINFSARPTRRVDLKFGIGYGDDIAKAKGILERIVGGEARVLKDPAPVIAVHELGDSSVNLILRPWVNSGDYWAVYWALTERVKLEFDAQGISIPFPQRDVHLHQVA